MINFKGCMTALITPFDRKLEVDYEGLRKLIRLQISNKASGVVVLGTTGESPTIREPERKRIVTEAVDEAGGRIPVIVGTGTNSTEKTIEYTREAEACGADGVLVVSPYYSRPSQEGLYRHFSAVAASVRVPMIIYNIQGSTGINIETQTLLRLSRLKGVSGVKEASGSISQAMDVMNALPDSFAMMSGDDEMTLPLIALGGDGVICTISNLLPGLMSEMVGAALDGDMERARVLHYKLMPLFRAAKLETNPVPIKAAMELAGLPSGGVRLPLCGLAPQNMEILRETLSRYKELTGLGKGKGGR
jgi:4-hydroxy-tetrahydrodipicolinate synthase